MTMRVFSDVRGRTLSENVLWMAFKVPISNSNQFKLPFK